MLNINILKYDITFLSSRMTETVIDTYNKSVGNISFQDAIFQRNPMEKYCIETPI